MPDLEYPQEICDPDYWEATEDQYIDPNEYLLIQSEEVLRVLVELYPQHKALVDALQKISALLK